MNNNNNITIDETALSGFTQEEQDVILQMMKEFSSLGKSKTYEELLYADYKEIPVDIETFLTNDTYLGRAWKDALGNSKVYPFWMQTLKEIFPTNITTNYEVLLESGARGIGKSEIACGACGAYLMYRVLCMKNPLEYYHLKPTEKIVFAFMNIKKELAMDICISKFQKTVQLSPWFMRLGRMTTLEGNDYWVPPEPIDIVIGSQSDDVIGLPIYFAFFDEISFIRNQDVDKQKERAKNMIDTAIGGMFTRFIHNGKNPTLLVVASSKRSEQSFMEQYIKSLSTTMKDKTYVVDKPVWEIKPKGTYSDKTFKVGVGDKFHASVVIGDNEDLDSYREKNYRIIDVPIDFKPKFEQDIERGLCDFAGISSSSLSKYMSGEIVADCIRDDFVNPFPDIIESSNAKDDKSQYSQFFNIEAIPSELMSLPLFVHLDMSVSGGSGKNDNSGLAGVWITGKKVSTDEEEQANDLSFRLAFATSIKAPKGRQISFKKNRDFIRWLRDVGFNIVGVSYDSFQSVDTGQQLEADGFNCKKISVDIVDRDGVCKPYQYLKNTIYEQRLLMPKCERLYDEFVDVERNINTGKIDHTPNCFTGDTKIRLVDGRVLTFIELLKEYLEGKVNYVYSMNETTHKIEPNIIKNVWCSGKTNILYLITLDNGEQIKCTPEHLFMLRNGEYLEAKELVIGDSLMPLYTKVSQKGLCGYRLYYEPFEDTWHYEHREFAKDVLDEKYLVHHLDFNKLNNNPTNLLWMSKAKHVEIHSNTNSGAFSSMAQLKRSESVKMWHKLNKDTVDYKERIRKQVKSLKHLYGSDSPEFLTANERKHLQTLNTIKEYFPEVDITTLDEHMIRSLTTKIQHLRGQHINYDNAHTKAAKKLKAHNEKTKLLKKLFPKINAKEFEQYFGFKFESLPTRKRAPWINRYRQKLYDIYNHSIKDIQILFVDEVPVYDMEIENNHNFALDSGIFVHNSHKDILDAVCGATFNASSYAEQFALNYGENLQDIVELNEVIDSKSAIDDAFNKAFEEGLLTNRLAPKLKKVDEGLDKLPNQDDWSDIII